MFQSQRGDYKIAQTTFFFPGDLVVVHVALLGLQSVSILFPPWRLNRSSEATINHLFLFTKMQLTAEEKMELGFTEQMTVNPAFEVRRALS